MFSLNIQWEFFLHLKENLGHNVLMHVISERLWHFIFADIGHSGWESR